MHSAGIAQSKSAVRCAMVTQCHRLNCSHWCYCCLYILVLVTAVQNHFFCRRLPKPVCQSTLSQQQWQCRYPRQQCQATDNSIPVPSVVALAAAAIMQTSFATGAAQSAELQQMCNVTPQQVCVRELYSKQQRSSHYLIHGLVLMTCCTYQLLRLSWYTCCAEQALLRGIL